jgi:hypothetical protein
MTDTSITAKLLSGAAHATPADPAATEAQPDPDLRILASIKKATGKQLLKEQKLTRERDKAIAANLSNALGVLEGETLRDFFAGLEGLATASQRKLIATHPLRPEGVDEIIEKVDAKRAKDAEAAKAEREAQRQRKEREEFERLKQKFEAGGGNAASEAKSDE